MNLNEDIEDMHERILKLESQMDDLDILKSQKDEIENRIEGLEKSYKLKYKEFSSYEFIGISFIILIIFLIIKIVLEKVLFTITLNPFSILIWDILWVFFFIEFSFDFLKFFIKPLREFPQRITKKIISKKIIKKQKKIIKLKSKNKKRNLISYNIYKILSVVICVSVEIVILWISTNILINILPILAVFWICFILAMVLLIYWIKLDSKLEYYIFNKIREYTIQRNNDLLSDLNHVISELEQIELNYKSEPIFINSILSESIGFAIDTLQDDVNTIKEEYSIAKDDDIGEDEKEEKDISTNQDQEEGL
jgi:hypothetical protein